MEDHWLATTLLKIGLKLKVCPVCLHLIRMACMKSYRDCDIRRYSKENPGIAYCFE